MCMTLWNHVYKNFAVKFQAVAEKTAINVGGSFLPHPVEHTGYFHLPLSIINLYGA